MGHDQAMWDDMFRRVGMPTKASPEGSTPAEPVEGHDHAKDDVTPPHRCHACGGYVTKHAADPETFVPGGYFCDDCGEAAK